MGGDNATWNMLDAAVAVNSCAVRQTSGAGTQPAGCTHQVHVRATEMPGRPWGAWPRGVRQGTSRLPLVLPFVGYAIAVDVTRARLGVLFLGNLVAVDPALVVLRRLAPWCPIVRTEDAVRLRIDQLFDACDGGQVLGGPCARVLRWKLNCTRRRA